VCNPRFPNPESNPIKWIISIKSSHKNLNTFMYEMPHLSICGSAMTLNIIPLRRNSLSILNMLDLASHCRLYFHKLKSLLISKSKSPSPSHYTPTRCTILNQFNQICIYGFFSIVVQQTPSLLEPTSQRVYMVPLTLGIGFRLWIYL